MIREWIKALLHMDQKELPPPDETIGNKLRALENMKRLNEAVAHCEPHQLAELEIGAETISLNLKKGTDKVKEKRV